MKYSQALERSVPQWEHHNIDYNELKSLIRTHTSPPPGSAKPVVISGQEDEELERFEARFARELRAQHASVDLFARSKADEFRRRLARGPGERSDDVSAKAGEACEIGDEGFAVCPLPPGDFEMIGDGQWEMDDGWIMDNAQWTMDGKLK
ncbi:hypothetical protein V500_01242 [Pseudogymnoascus sp. VKM F-4518 (FW-2643)]|nr:hypothetical protein V500_01242 [Pseudogymnoascus sp. VKM F-4518 (FW-2643)]